MIADARRRARLCNVERLSQRAVQARAEHLAIVQALQAGDAERARDHDGAPGRRGARSRARWGICRMKTDAARLARCIVAEPLTSQAFAEFGEVVEHAGNERRRHLAPPYAHSAPARARPSGSAGWMAPYPRPARCCCWNVIRIPRRPSSRWTTPLSRRRGAGRCAGRAGPGTAARLRRQRQPGRVLSDWRLAPGPRQLRAPAQFAVTMTLTGAGDDDVF